MDFVLGGVHMASIEVECLRVTSMLDGHVLIALVR